MTSMPAQDHPQPQSLTDLFVSFTLLALQGFGGVLAVVQRELVEKKRWMTREEFIEDWAVAQIMPGPNVVNLSMMIGARSFGLKGAMAALAGMLTVPLILVLLLALVYAQFAGHPKPRSRATLATVAGWVASAAFLVAIAWPVIATVLLLALVYAQFADHPGVAGALRGMSAVAAGLIAATGLKLTSALLKNALGLRLCVAFGVLCFVAIALLRWPLVYVLFGPTCTASWSTSSTGSATSSSMPRSPLPRLPPARMCCLSPCSAGMSA